MYQIFPKLVIPSLRELVNMWTRSYLFTPIGDFLTKQLRKLNVVAFLNTNILQKRLLPEKGSLGSIGKSMTIGDLNHKFSAYYDMRKRWRTNGLSATRSN